MELTSILEQITLTDCKNQVGLTIFLKWNRRFREVGGWMREKRGEVDDTVSNGAVSIVGRCGVWPHVLPVLSWLVRAGWLTDLPPPS